MCRAEFPNGRLADPWPDESSQDRKNVPTFRSNQDVPETAKRQRDYVFASTDLSDSLTVRALNAADEWGPSANCRSEFELAPGA